MHVHRYRAMQFSRVFYRRGRRVHPFCARSFFSARRLTTRRARHPGDSAHTFKKPPKREKVTSAAPANLASDNGHKGWTGRAIGDNGQDRKWVLECRAKGER